MTRMWPQQIGQSSKAQVQCISRQGRGRGKKKKIGLSLACIAALQRMKNGRLTVQVAAVCDERGRRVCDCWKSKRLKQLATVAGQQSLADGPDSGTAYAVLSQVTMQ